VGVGRGVHHQVDLVTVLKVSQDISTQRHGSGIVRAVLTGIAQNAGADRVVFVLRSATGVETVYGEVVGGAYVNIDVPLDSYPRLPRSVVRVVRRTGRPLVVGDAMTDPAHAADPFVIESRGRSIAGIPIRRKGSVAGLVMLENRMIAGAFTPQLVSLTEALVAQAAISLDNAALYQDLENRVNERTCALNTRNAEMRMVLDRVLDALRNDGHALAHDVELWRLQPINLPSGA
jgi:GAF domain-containing protein